jgi:hypothetical protein
LNSPPPKSAHNQLTFWAVFREWHEPAEIGPAGSYDNGEEITVRASLRLPFTPGNLPFLTVDGGVYPLAVKALLKSENLKRPDFNRLPPKVLFKPTPKCHK